MGQAIMTRRGGSGKYNLIPLDTPVVSGASVKITLPTLEAKCRYALVAVFSSSNYDLAIAASFAEANYGSLAVTADAFVGAASFQNISCSYDKSTRVLTFTSENSTFGNSIGSATFKEGFIYQMIINLP